MCWYFSVLARFIILCVCAKIIEWMKNNSLANIKARCWVLCRDVYFIERNVYNKYIKWYITHKQSGGKVSGWVQRISTIKPKTHSKTKNSKTQHSGHHVICPVRPSVSSPCNVSPISDCADGDGKEGCGKHLVTNSSKVGEVGRGEGGKDGGSVRDRAEDAVLVFVPDQGVPVEEEDQAGSHQGSKVLGKKIVRNLSPGKPAHHSQGHGDGRVQMTSRDSATDHYSKKYSNSPTAIIKTKLNIIPIINHSILFLFPLTFYRLNYFIFQNNAKNLCNTNITEWNDSTFDWFILFPINSRLWLVICRLPQ